MLRVRLSSLLVRVGNGGGGAFPGRASGIGTDAPARMESPASRRTAMNWLPIKKTLNASW